MSVFDPKDETYIADSKSELLASAAIHGTSVAVPDDTPPEMIGRYLVRKVLGTGGFGVVYLAQDED